MEFQFASLADFLAMNGHGPFVWVAYGVTLATMAGLLLQPVQRKRQLQREFLREQRIRARRADSRQTAHARVMETAAAE